MLFVTEIVLYVTEIITKINVYCLRTVIFKRRGFFLCYILGGIDMPTQRIEAKGTTLDTALEALTANAAGRKLREGRDYTVCIFERENTAVIGSSSKSYDAAFLSALQEAGITREAYDASSMYRLEVTVAARADVAARAAGAGPRQEPTLRYTESF